MLCLCRIMEASGGSIRIDGVDTATVSVRDLRGRVGVIPQDATLFAGSVRYNLDPTGKFSTAECSEALSKVALLGHVQLSMEGGLDAAIDEGGTNLSAGQRQLLCMARVLLTRPKVLIMDEATASVDMATDAMLQAMLSKDFTSGTLLTIAHRLETVLTGYDKVLVLEGGQVAEFGTPQELLAREDGAFAALVAEHRRQTAAVEASDVQVEAARPE